MANFPNSLDDDVTLPPVSNNITEIGEELLNSLRDVAFAIEEEIGIGASGTTSSIADRLDVCFNPDGTLKPSAITSLSDGLTTVNNWIYDAHVAAAAGIVESKLALDYSTADLNTRLNTLQSDIDSSLSYIQTSGSKLGPHINGLSYRHILSHIDVSTDSDDYLKDRNGTNRDNSNLYTLLSAINDELISHQKEDNSGAGTVPPINFAHVAAGIYINPSSFTFIPQTTTDLQSLAEFVDTSSATLLGTRIQTFYSAGIARTSRAGGLNNTENGQPIVPSTTVITNFLSVPTNPDPVGYPVDDIYMGDDIVEFLPSQADLDSFYFESQFALVKIGDILTVNYVTFEVPNVILEKKIISDGDDKRYIVRINRKNIIAGNTYTARIDKPLANNNKHGVLALAQANIPSSELASLIVGNPRGAQILGQGFNPKQIDSNHYNLYLELYPNGNPNSSKSVLTKIDITGNNGVTPGKYTLESIVETTNSAFRAKGYNYRFIAFSYNGEFGIMLADPYGNAGFSIISGVVISDGTYDSGLSAIAYPKNVIGTYGTDDYDALGIGPNKGNLASPAYSSVFTNTTTAQIPTKVFLPLSRNNYYVDGTERERFNLEQGQIIDTYGDGYWQSTIVSKSVIPGVRVSTTYRVNNNLSDSGLKIGKTIVAQSSSGLVDSGRYFISDLQFNCPDGYTNITVYDAVHATGISPYLCAAVGTNVNLYFTSDSVGFSAENASDIIVENATQFKRHFEIYVDKDGYTFSHERARFVSESTSGVTVNGVDFYTDNNLLKLNIHKVSPTLRGYAFSSVNKINFVITTFDQYTGVYSGYLRKWDGSTASHEGPVITGKQGEIVRFYDETNVDYIDIIFELTDTISIGALKHVDIQIFPTLRLDDELMLLGTCQFNDQSNKIEYLRDERQFGNISEAQFSNSALNYISETSKLINENGIIRGFEVEHAPFTLSGPNANVFYISGGVALINGKVVEVNDELLSIPVVKEYLVASATTINTVKWFLCLNESGKFEFIASTDFEIESDGTSTEASYDTDSLDHTRIMYVKNPNHAAGTYYPIKATYFSDLVLNYKNLVPIAVITGPIILSGTKYIIGTGVYEDARRFISNGHSGLTSPFTFGSISNFRTFESLNTWLTNLNSFKSANINVVNKIGDIVLVKDTMDISSKIFDFGKQIKFIGDGGRFTIESTAIMKNIHLENLRVDTVCNPAILFKGVQNNINQCYISNSIAADGYVIALDGYTVADGYPSIRVTNNIFTSSTSIKAFIDGDGTIRKLILIGNVYSSGKTLLSISSTHLPSTINDLNANDGV